MSRKKSSPRKSPRKSNNNRSRSSTSRSSRKRVNQGARKRSVSSRRQRLENAINNNYVVQRRINLNRSPHRQQLLNLRNQINTNRVAQRKRIPLFRDPYSQNLLNLQNEIDNNRVAQRNRIPLTNNDDFLNYYDVQGPITSSPVNGYNARTANVPWQGLDLSPIAQEQSRFNYEDGDLTFGSFGPGEGSPHRQQLFNLQNAINNNYVAQRRRNALTNLIIDNDDFPNYYDVQGPITSSPVNGYNARTANVPWQDPDTGLDLSPIGQEQSRFNYEDSDISSFRPEHFDTISEARNGSVSPWRQRLENAINNNYVVQRRRNPLIQLENAINNNRVAQRRRYPLNNYSSFNDDDDDDELNDVRLDDDVFE